MLTRWLLHPNLFTRFLAFLIVVGILFFLAWALSYALLPEGVLRGRTAAAALAGETAAASFWAEWARIAAVNLAVCLCAVIAPNLIKNPSGVPLGYTTTALLAALYAVTLGTNSFTLPLPGGPLAPTLAVFQRSGPYEITAYVLAAASTVSIARWALRGRWPRQVLEPWAPPADRRMGPTEWVGLALAAALLLAANAWEAWQIIAMFGSP